jgi:hypothetical protein
MTTPYKKLEELFNMPSDETDDIEKDDDIKEEYTPPLEFIDETTLESLDRITQALPTVQDLSATDSEMDDLANEARKAFSDLMTMGMQTDPRFASEIFSTAGTMLGHAITAKTAKANKRIKMFDLQLKKAELDRKLAAQENKTPQISLGEVKPLDRTELLRMLRDEAKSENKDK